MGFFGFCFEYLSGSVILSECDRVLAHHHDYVPLRDLGPNPALVLGYVPDRVHVLYRHPARHSDRARVHERGRVRRRQRVQIQSTIGAALTNACIVAGVSVVETPVDGVVSACPITMLLSTSTSIPVPFAIHVESSKVRHNHNARVQEEGKDMPTTRSWSTSDSGSRSSPGCTQRAAEAPGKSEDRNRNPSKRLQHEHVQERDCVLHCARRRD